jgi:6-phospho-beta-glucosidase
MRLTVVGGGGFRVPLVHRALIEAAAGGDGLVDELVLVDTDRRRLSAIMPVLEHQEAAHPGIDVAVRAMADLDDGLRGADLVFSAIRVGGLAGRIVDEQVALREGVLGQETVGAGGISYGLRTVPVARRLASRIVAQAPSAWVVNFTNPAGVVTEAMAQVLGDRVIGICDSPVSLGRRAAQALGLDPSRASFDYAGLNHLGWLRGLHVDGRDRLPELVADPTVLASLEEGQLFGTDWLQAIGAIPNEYLHYYYFAREARTAAAAAASTRGEVVAAQQTDFYERAAADPAEAHALWAGALQAREETYMAENRAAVSAGPRVVDELDGGGYTGVALAVMRAIARDEPARLIVDVRNRGAIPGVAPESVVEVPCVVDANGARPLPVRPLHAHQAALIGAVKAVEVQTITAALSGSRRAALLAFAWHPLVDSVAVARRLLDAYLAQAPGLAEILDRE